MTPARGLRTRPGALSKRDARLSSAPVPALLLNKVPSAKTPSTRQPTPVVFSSSLSRPGLSFFSVGGGCCKIMRKIFDGWIIIINSE